MSPPILLLIALFLAVTVVGGLVGVRQLDAASSAQVRIATARNTLDGLLQTQLSAETGLRGYVATGQRYFLEPDGPPSETFDVRADQLVDALRGATLDASANARVDDLRTAHTEWLQTVESPLLANPSGRDALEMQTRGKLLTDRMRGDAQVLRADLQAAAQDVEISLRRRVNATVATSVGIIALFAIATLALGLSRAQAVQALAREQSMVSALQQTLRVTGVQLPRTSVGYAYTSATREALVGGDLIDTWRADSNRGWFLIADASGKGIEAARHSAFVQYAIRTLTAECDDPGDVLARFNRLFLDTFDDPGIFVVLFLGAFDATTGMLRYASAGHATAFVRRRDRIEQFSPTGPIIGLDRHETYGVRSVHIPPGDLILLATDGLTESRDDAGDMLGDEGVIAMLAATDAEPQALCDVLVAEVERRSHGEVADDLAILALRILAVDDDATLAPFAPSGAEKTS